MCIDQQYDLKFKEHLSKLQKERESVIQQQKLRSQEDLKKYKTLLSEISSLS